MHAIQKFIRLVVPASIAAVSLSAATQQPLVQAEQDFAIRDRLYQAGTYRVKEVSPAGLMTLRHEASGQTILLMTNRKGSTNSAGPARLVFQHRQGQARLAEVWTGNGPGHVIR